MYHFCRLALSSLLLLVLATCTVGQLDDIGATPNTQQIGVAIRTQRDLAQHLPINRVPGPGISLDSALLNGNYSSVALRLAEFLVVNYVSRLVLDIYWDNTRRMWQLCPVALPLESEEDTPNTGQETEIAADGVICSKTPITVWDFVDAVKAWMSTEEDSQKTFTPVTIIFNLRDAAGQPPDDPIVYEPVSQDWPSSIFFTPDMLAKFRSSGVPALPSPYYIVDRDETTGELTTPNGWPRGQSLISARTHLLAGFGSVNLKNSTGFDRDRDSHYIFDEKEINGVPDIDVTMLPDKVSVCARPGPGIAMSGTGIDRSQTKYSAVPTSGERVVSWSWPFIVDSAAEPQNPAFVSEIVRCGFQPLFATDISVELMTATVWSWDTGQPQSGRNLDCAVFRRSSGRWYTDRCSNKHLIACQSETNPFEWQIADVWIEFRYASNLCPAGYIFGVPRTPQENDRLLSTIRRRNDVEEVWINLNQVSFSCWVIGWQTPCPYQVTDINYRAILGATLKQGLVIVVIFAVFGFFKCRRQLRVSRQNRRKAEVRRKIRQRDYVTVPA
ncbi:hypothetical protein HDU85_003357 [Gaertneriomyces sp. JEL0708]|nr:hypothetical protein HDU85_003357 [Gaertneriomyces sp. JEL0708]